MSKSLFFTNRDHSMSTGPGRRVAIYVHRSDFAGQKPVRAYAATQRGDWRIIKVCKGNRHTSIACEGARMVRDARHGMFDTLLVHSLGRVSRCLHNLAPLLDPLADADVVVCSATKPFDRSTSLGRQFRAVLSVSGQIDASLRCRVAAAGRQSTPRGSHHG